MRIWRHRLTNRIVYKDEMIKDFEAAYKVKYEFAFHAHAFERYSKIRCNPHYGDLIEIGECY